MEEKVIELRKRAIDFDRMHIIQACLKTEDGLFREQFIELIREALYSYFYGCSRASVIMSGEALLRAILYKINCFKDRIKILQEEEEMLESNHFSTAIYILRKNKIYCKDTIEKMKIIKDLRNLAVHGDLPVLNEWNPDDGKCSKDELFKLLKRSIEIPEGYIFILNNRDKKKQVTFDLRDYTCGSLKQLSNLDKYAVIQVMFLIDVIESIYNTTENINVFPNN